MRSRMLAGLYSLLLLQPLPGAVAPWPTDGWAQSTPQEQGLNRALLQAGNVYIQSQCPTRYSFLVVRHGYLVWEQYYHGMSQNGYADVMSVSKSVLSLLIGQALDSGRIASLDRKLVDYFPEYFTSSTDPRKRLITLRHMLTMTAGFQWDEVATGNNWVVSKDWYKFVINLPMAANPGDVFDYNTGLSHLLAGVLSRASGQSALAFGVQNLFAPLGISTEAASTVGDIGPALFLWGNFAAAQHADYAAVGAPGLIPGMTTSPAQPGETILLYGTGFGETTPATPVGEIARQAASLPSLPVVSIGGVAAVVEYAGIPQGGVGLYQINVRVPDCVADGDLPISVVYGQAEAPIAYLTVHRP